MPKLTKLEKHIKDSETMLDKEERQYLETERLVFSTHDDY